MKTNKLSRRTFIKGSIGAGVAVAVAPSLAASGAATGYNSRGLPTAILGRTGVRIPRVAIGLGSRFCNIENEEKALELLTYALDHGLYYWDTAYIYENKKNGVVSEERVGKIIKDRRTEIFLSTKVTSRDPDEAKRQIESSLKRLQTDKLDMLKIHSVESKEDIEKMSGKGQLIEIVQGMKEQGVTRYIGFSGHNSAEAMKVMAERGIFDSMLIAMNQWRMDSNPQQRQQLAIPAALEEGMGVMMMKVVRPKENIEGIKAADLVRFALSVKGPNGIVVGMDSLEVVKSNLELLRSFAAMDPMEQKRLERKLSPFFRHEDLEWTRPDYRDGNWA